VEDAHVLALEQLVVWVVLKVHNHSQIQEDSIHRDVATSLVRNNVLATVSEEVVEEVVLVSLLSLWLSRAVDVASLS